MKTLRYILLAILLGLNLVACTPDDPVQELQEIETLETEVMGNKGDKGNVEEEDDE